jgi:hypothetical protein
MNLYESGLPHTLEKATELANQFSKEYYQVKIYHTAIKVSIDAIDKICRNIYSNEVCWIVTNRFDPRVAKRLKELEDKKYEFCNPNIDSRAILNIYWSEDILDAICSNCGEDFGAHIGLTCPKGEKQ